MIVDFKDANTQTEAEFDVCIVGGGAAGISLALELANTSLRVGMLESGADNLDADTQGLYGLKEVGQMSGLAAMRLRFLGGTTNHWEGYCGPLDPLDFEARNWIEHSGWPLTRKELDPYYERAHGVCELGPYAYDTQTLALENRTYPNFDDAKLEMKLWQRSPPTRFGERYRGELEAAENVVVYLNANVTKLSATPDGSRISSAELSTVGGGDQSIRTGKVTAKCFVLACGGIENIRLLLLSDDVVSQGLGNQNDNVGRYWMQHPWLETATVVATDEERYEAELTTHLFSEYSLKAIQTTVLPGASLTPARQRKDELLNLMVTIRGGRSTNTGYHELKRIGGRLKRGEWPDDFGTRLGEVLSDLGSVVDGITSRIQGERYQGPFIDPTIYAQVEQAPNAESRVYLDGQVDKLGLRRTVVNWQLSPLEKQTMLVAMQLFGEEFARLGLGRVRLAEWLADGTGNYPNFVAGGGHHMGGTRMASDASKGVVDPNCKVFGVDNLYIAGSSVFPTGGCMNPTLTIVALALRLADEVKKTYVA